MDQYIQNLKFFIDGLGVRDVEFPEELTPQEINLIVELCITAAQTETQCQRNGYEKVLGILWRRVREELGTEGAAKLLKTLSDSTNE